MKALYLIVTTLLIVQAFAQPISTSNTSLTNIQMASYQIDNLYNWRIDSTKQSGADLFLFSPLQNKEDKFSENINVITQNVEDATMDLDKYVNLSEEQIKTMAADAKTILSERVRKGISVFHRLIFSATQGGFNLMFEQYYFVNSGKAFVITFTAEANKYEQCKIKAENILNSFLINKD